MRSGPFRLARLWTEARFLSRSLGKRAGKFAIVLLAIATGVSVMATAWNLSTDLEAKFTRELRAHGPNALVVGTGSPFGDPTETIREALEPPGSPALGESGSTSNVLIAPLLSAVGRTPQGGFAVSGVDFDAERVLGSSWSIEGEWPSGPGECLCGSRLARLIGAAAGKDLRIEIGSAPAAPLECRVSGLIQTGESEDEQLLVALPLLQQVASYPGKVSAVALRLSGNRDEIAGLLDRVRGALVSARSMSGGASELAGPSGPLEARLLRAASESEGRLLDRLERMMNLLGALILGLSGMCVMTTLIALVVEREPEIGLMRSIGAGDGDIVRMLLGEAALLGIAGGVLGWGIGAVAARLLGPALLETTIEPSLSVMPPVIGLAVILCAAGVVLPLRRALAVRPAVALKGE